MGKVLLVDDSPVIHRLLTKKINLTGNHVVGCAIDGNDGYEKFQLLKPDLVIMDITMPNCDGREGLRRILADSPAAKVLMLSAVAQPEIIDECMKLGAAGFISKTRLSEANYVENHILSLLSGQAKSA